MKQSRFKRKGWILESHRHSLAAKGIKTGRKSRSVVRKFKTPQSAYDYVQGLPNSARISVVDRDNVPGDLFIKKVSDKKKKNNVIVTKRKSVVCNNKKVLLCSKGEKTTFSKLINRKIDKKIVETDNKNHEAALLKAKNESKFVKTRKQAVQWIKRHKLILITTGLTPLLFAVAGAFGVGVVMEEVATGNIVRVGATKLGSLLNIAGVVVGGHALYLGIGEEGIEGKEAQVRKQLSAGKISQEYADKEIALLEKQRPEKREAKQLGVKLAQGGEGKVRSFRVVDVY